MIKLENVAPVALENGRTIAVDAATGKPVLFAIPTRKRGKAGRWSEGAPRGTRLKVAFAALVEADGEPTLLRSSEFRVELN